MPTITIRNLDEQVKRRLRVIAAEHGRSMEAEARAILTRETMGPKQSGRPANYDTSDEMPPSVCDDVRGTWKGRMRTDEIMTITRGE
jgi:plasmid stability protein